MSNWLPVIALALIPAAPLPKESKKPELQSIVGEWLCETVTSEGRTERLAEAKEPIIYTFSADGVMMIRNGRTHSKGTYTTDAKKEPAALDWDDAQRPRGPTLAIYKIEKDTLTLCFPVADVPAARNVALAGRPTAFEAPAGSRLVLMTFKRVEKKKE